MHDTGRETICFCFFRTKNEIRKRNLPQQITRGGYNFRPTGIIILYNIGGGVVSAVFRLLGDIYGKPPPMERSLEKR